jgi:ubiquinone biosynthesis protein UbiJ
MNELDELYEEVRQVEREMELLEERRETLFARIDNELESND